MSRRKIVFGLILALLVILPVARAQDVEPIQYGDSIRGRITDPEQGILYSFEARRGDVINITLSSQNTDVYLRLGDENGNILAEDDDISDSNLNASIQYVVLEDGTYIVVALAYDPGSYVLELEKPGGGGGGSTQDEVTEISYGDVVSGEAIDIDTPVVYTFTGKAGETVSVAVVSDAVDTYVVLADAEGNTIVENDDVSSDNLNSYVETVLPANGDYLIGVFAYEAGPFDLELIQGSGGVTTEPVSDTGGDAQTFTGSLNNDEYFVEYPLEGVEDGQTITIDARATSGDLDVYVGLFQGERAVAENDDRDRQTTDSFLEYTQAQAGDYSVVVTRYGFDEGETSGDFQVSIKVGDAASVVSTGGGTEIAAGYPTLSPTPNIAEWTVLVYMGGDNNLEDGLENDLDEFERAGGSTEDVRIVTLLDRSDEYSRSNGNWTDTRLFEPGTDRSRDYRSVYPPTIDTAPLGDLGELDTSYPSNLLDFIVWGVRSFPAQRYAVILNDHGGAWYGIVTDDTTGQGAILTIPELSQVFDAALKNTGVEQFDLLINDACLMSGVEYYAAMSRFFRYSISSPEITLNPSFDMELLTETLNDQPNIDMEAFGKVLVDKYLQDMAQLSPDTWPVLGAAVTDLQKFDAVTEAVENFASVVNENPDAYVSVLGRARSNTYAYSFFLPEDQYGPPTNIDVGDFMKRVIRASDDRSLTNAAQAVLDALDDVRMYADAGDQLYQFSTFYNIYFPPSASSADGNYRDQSPLRNWTQMLANFYSSAGPQFRSFRAVTAGVPAASPVAAPSLIPRVSITNLYPQTAASIALPVTVSMEVTGRNISEGKFTVDQIQPDGTAVRLTTSRIVTEVVTDGVADYINLWNPGVDDFDFTWDVQLPTVTDGTVTGNEQVVTSDGVSSLSGRYQYPGQSDWVEVTVLFDDNYRTDRVISRHENSAALATVRLDAGGIFQTYRSVVTPDGQVKSEPGMQYTWPEDGITYSYAPAPTGRYNLGFLIEAVGGTTGFGAVNIDVDNSQVDPALLGFVDNDWGFGFQRPASWYDVNYFPDPGFLQTSDLDSSQYFFVYPVYDSDGDLEAIAQDVLDQYGLEVEGGFKDITVDGKDAVEFRFAYSNDSGDFTGRAFAVFNERQALGLVFSSESLDGDVTDSNYELLLDTTTFFDAVALAEQDTGFWGSDFFTEETRYPVPQGWLPGGEDGDFWYYRPDNADSGPTFAAVSVLTGLGDDPAGSLPVVLEDYVEDLEGYDLQGTETYYGELNNWEVATFSHEDAQGGKVTGRVYVTVVDGKTYALWFEAPEADFNGTFRDVFTVMVDGFKIEAPAS